jgi:hypothetical protein
MTDMKWGRAVSVFAPGVTKKQRIGAASRASRNAVLIAMRSCCVKVHITISYIRRSMQANPNNIS